MRLRLLFFVGLVLLGVSGIWAQDSNLLSKKELFNRARTVLLTSLEKKDFDRVKEAYAYLQANVSEGAPLSIFDEYMIDMELGRYADAIPKLATLGRMMFDSSYASEAKKERIVKDDALHKYLDDKFTSFTLGQLDSLVKLIDDSDVDPELKDLYATLIYARVVIDAEFYTGPSNKTSVRLSVISLTRADQFLERARSYVEKQPNAEHSGYLKTRIIPMVEKYAERKNKLDKDPYSYHYYSGGFHIFAGLWTGFMSGDATDYLETKTGNCWNLEAQLQIFRLTLGIFRNSGLISKLINYDEKGDLEDEAFGAKLGLIALDMRYVRIEPFFGFAGYTFSNVFEEENDGIFLVGLNSDVRLYTTRPDFMVFSLVLRLKYQAFFGTFSYHNSFEPCCGDTRERPPKDIEADFVIHQFGMELGLSLW